MSKYRVVQVGTIYKIQRKGWFFWYDLFQPHPKPPIKYYISIAVARLSIDDFKLKDLQPKCKVVYTDEDEALSKYEKQELIQQLEQQIRDCKSQLRDLK